MEDIEGGEPYGSQVHYISCMKINGVPLLPPLMTLECRQEMQYYKQLALAVERRITDLKVCMEDSTLYSNNHPSDTEECFDGTNISYDVQDRSSFSDKNISQTDLNTTEADHSEIGKLEEFFESNDFESMNSQVTIIDMSSEQQTDKASVKDSLKTTEGNILDGDNKTESTNPLVRSKHIFAKQLSLPGRIILNMENEKHELKESSNLLLLRSDEKKDAEKAVIQESRKTEVATSPLKTPSKEIKSVLTNSSSKSNAKKLSPSSTPLKMKKCTPVKKENISPMVTSKKITPKTKTISPYELQKTKKKIISIPKHKLSPSKNVTGSLNNISSGLTSPPKLVRQNSYTLESPSPLLLAHLEVQSITSGIDVSSISMSESTSTSQLCNLPRNKNDLIRTKDLWTSTGSDINSKSLSDEIFDSDNVIQQRVPKKISIVDQNLVEIENNRNMEHIDSLRKPDIQAISSNKSSEDANKVLYENGNKHNFDTKKYRTNDFANEIPTLEGKVRSGSRDATPQKKSQPIQNEFENKIVSSGIEILLDMKSNTGKENPNVYFDFIMRKCQEDHERQLNALITKQHEEQLLLKKTFENQQKLLMDQFQSAFSSPKEISNHILKKVYSPHVKNPKNPISDKHHFNDVSSSGSSESHQLHSFHRESPKQSREPSTNESMEKYLTISADVLNASRSLLINRKTVNLSPTDIQCVNVMPTQPIPPTFNDSSVSLNDDRLIGFRTIDLPLTKQTFIRNGSYDVPSLLPRQNNDVSYDSNRSYNYNDTADEPLETGRTNRSYNYNDTADEPLETGRTNNTLDDLNFTFSSDDVAHTNQYYTDGYKDEYRSNANYENRKEIERAMKLNKARSKITEIQKNLASQTLNRQSRGSFSEVNYFNKGAYALETDQTVSLSAIDVVSDYYPRNFADRNNLSLNLTEINKPSGNVQLTKTIYKTPQEIERETRAAATIVSHCKGYLTRRLLQTERVRATVQTIKDALLCALQLHRDEAGIRGADVDLHRRLIQQITAACYALHDIFIMSTPQERMMIIRQDRERKATLLQRPHSGASPQHRQLSATTQRVLRRKLEGMSRSHSGVFSSRSSRTSHYSQAMTRSHYDQSDHMRGGISDKSRRSLTVTGDVNLRKPWR